MPIWVKKIGVSKKKGERSFPGRLYKIAGLRGFEPLGVQILLTPMLLNQWFCATHNRPHPLKLFVTLKILS